MSSKSVSKKYQDFDARAAKLIPLFKATRFIHKHQLFRLFLYIPKIFINGWAYTLGPLALKTKKLRKRVFEGLSALYPNSKLIDKKKEKLLHANAIYMAMLYLDVMFNTVNINTKNLRKFVTVKGMDHIFAALKKGKGVIVPTLHVGAFFQVLATLCYYRPKLQITTVYQKRNQIMYEAVMARPELTNFHAIPSTSFKKLKPVLMNNLKQNHIFVVYYDYSSAHQLRVPFQQEKYPYLITTPQSIYKLHRTLGTPIIPAKLSPNGSFGKSIVEFTDPEPIMQISKQYQDAPKKTMLGEVSIKVNSILAPHMRKFNHLWEEFRKFTTRTSDSCDISANLTVKECVIQIENKIMQILTQSYESGRNDEHIIQVIQENFPKIISSLQSPATLIIEDHGINLSLMNAMTEIDTLLAFLDKSLKEANESKSVSLVESLREQLDEIFYSENP